MEDRRGTTDIEDWNFRFTEEGKEQIERLLKRGLREGLDLAFEHAGLQFASLGRVPGRSKKVSDPLTVYLSLDSLGIEGQTVSWSTTLGEMLEDYVEDCQQSGSSAAELRRISTALRALADRIDAALPR